MSRYIHLISLFYCILHISYSQVVYEPLRNSIYSFLLTMSEKGIIEINDQIKPLSRKVIAEKLIDIENNNDKLTGLEQEELSFFYKDFAFEIKKLKNNFPDGIAHMSYIGRDRNKRYRLFSYTDSLFHFNVSPVIGGVFGTQDGKSFRRQWNGIYFYGHIGKHFGFSFDLLNAGEKGENIDRTREFNSAHGIIPKGTDNPDQIDFNEINVMQTTSWDWGSFSIGKGNLRWGYGQSGDIVLSTKPPSYPHIRLDLQLTRWFNFNYMHAWLNSDVLDSSKFYSTGLPNTDRLVYRNKYFATHTFSFIPKKGLHISLGESVIYADNLQFAYLQPLMFFRAADHYLSKQNNHAGENSQFFFSIDSRNHINNTHLFGILFIDEIKMRTMFNNKNRNQIGYQVGASIVDIPVNNLKISTEYTRILPYVYRHYIPTQTYESSSYLMGHWIGHNADLIYCSADYRILRGLSVKLWGQYFRKGEDGSLEEQYSSSQPSFLFGLNTNRSWFGLDIKYEIVHELYVRAQLEFYKESVEESAGVWKDTDKRNFYFSVYYGM